MQKKYPFKYLDAYTSDDHDFYFGRKDEVQQLYEMTFQSDLLLVYGASGTGKTSLVQCGLSSCFKSYEWLPLTIRRGDDINKSLEKVLDNAIGEETEYFDDDWDTENETDNSPLAQKIKTLRLKYFKPIYLIFDQFEELYILGKKEDTEEIIFYKTIEQLRALRHPVKIIIIIREEYLGHLDYFEKIVPDIFRKKLRVEPMNLEKVKMVLLGINNPEKSLVTLQKGAENELIKAIYEKLREGKNRIVLPYLQVLLDNLYLELTKDEQYQETAELTCEALNYIGNIGDILSDLLDELVWQLEKDKNILPETTWKTLSSFVTAEGTKKPLNVADVEKLEVQIPEINEILQFCKRIFRYDENKQEYEIVHDALANKINDNRTKEEKMQLQIKKMIRDKLLLNKSENLCEYFNIKQLKEINSYIDRSELNPVEDDLIKKSEEEAGKVDEQKRRTLRNTRLALLITASSVILMIFAFWQQNLSNQEKVKEKEQRMNTEKELLYYKMNEFNDFEKNARNLIDDGYDPKIFIDRMQEIADDYPDIKIYKETIEKLKELNKY